ncbi:hypothetical protein DSO57_1039806 [Entomophthora muscae]|uniref:Uncharacterized protein n=1 Tax=Entomophthora muscae TaxID=34485 RepID=A0ACC2U738_9FUNG|nr:hypothetical protein DSO57_1039806 [Entomophthora muscae]
MELLEQIVAGKSLESLQEPLILKPELVKNYYLPLPGEWKCSRCQCRNFRGRSACYCCGSGILETAPHVFKLDFISGDWLCLSCFGYNFLKEIKCRSCSSLRLDNEYIIQRIHNPTLYQDLKKGSK